MSLVKDIIIHILRITCKFSNKDCKNARLVCKYASKDWIILNELRSRFNKFVKHDLINQHVVIDISNFALPSDELIEKQIFTGLFDDERNFDPNYMFNNINNESPNKDDDNKFKKLLQLQPKADFILSSSKSLDLNNWEIFNYPIINTSGKFPISNIFILLESDHIIVVPCGCVNMLRLMLTDAVNSNKYFTQNIEPDNCTQYRVSKNFDLIEAIYFVDDIPNQIILSAMNYNLKIKPTRKYTYLGMISCNAYNNLHIVVPDNVKFNVIVWMVNRYGEFRELERHNSFYNKSNSLKRIISYKNGVVNISEEKIVQN